MMSDDENLTDEFMELALVMVDSRRGRTFLEQPNHFIKWRDDQFVSRFRLCKNSVYFILDQIKENVTSPINRNNAITPEEKLLLTLRYYATGSFQAVCGDFVGVNKSTASQIIRLVSHKLALLRPKFINFPSTSAEIDVVRQKFFDIAKFPRCIGAIDCTHVKIKSPGGLDGEIYRNWKGFFSINVQTICDADLRIQDIVCTFPGSNHDSTIFNHSNISGQFERGEMSDSILVGDSGYALKKYLMTPFLNPIGEGQNIYNESQIRSRNVVERSYNVWKKRFPILAVGINMNLEFVESIIVATAVLHNIACYFGEETPRVSHQMEKEIDSSTFSTRIVADNANNDGTLQRNNLVQYFERPNHFIKWRDDQFVSRFRLCKNSVYFILGQIKENVMSPINRNNAITPEEKLLLTLRYYATGSFQAVCGDFVGVNKSTASQIIRLVSHKLALLRPKFINFPSTPAEIDVVRQKFFDIAKFPRCIGAIDCTHVKIKSPGGLDGEIYRNWKGFFSINVQTICDADFRIQDIVCTFPGSNRDSTIFNHSNVSGQFERGEMSDSILVGDSGYALKKYLMTPFLNPIGEGQNKYNESQIRSRNVVERSYNVWKKRFPILAVGINMNLKFVESIIVATAVLHNIACYFGEETPRVSHQMEKEIDSSTFSTRIVADNANNDGTLQRHNLVQYFESL